MGSSSRTMARRWRWLAAALLGITAVLAVYLPKRPGPDQPSVAIVGGPSLRVVARRGGRSFRVADGDKLAPGDELRFSVTPMGLVYLLVVSIGADGQTHVYFPSHGSASAKIDPRRPSELSEPVVVDGAPGPERVFALLSQKPLGAWMVLEALRQLGAEGQKTIRATRTLPIAVPAQLSLRIEKSS
jgi:hypothetical protein